MMLTQNYATTLKNHFLECAFCGSRMSPETANTICDSNPNCEKGSYEAVKAAEKIIERDAQISVEQAVDYIGTGKHYWVQGDIAMEFTDSSCDANK